MNGAGEAAGEPLIRHPWTFRPESSGRRTFRVLAACLVALLSGIASANDAQTKQKSGAEEKKIAYFVDEAAKAGLTQPNTFGGVDTKKYIIETTGTGVAMFDYDNDGWPDIFVVNGTTLESMPGK